MISHGGKPELYDVVGDPAERRDVSAQYPDLTKQLREELDCVAQDGNTTLVEKDDGPRRRTGSPSVGDAIASLSARIPGLLALRTTECAHVG